MNILPFEKQVAVVSVLTEVVSIRATERLTGIHRDAVMRLGVRVGEGCAKVHETIRMTPAKMLGVTDHIWTVAELIEATTSQNTPEPEGRRVGRLRVIDSGLS